VAIGRNIPGLARAVAAAVLVAGALPPAAEAEWSPQKAAQIDGLVQIFLTPRTGRVSPPALSLAIGVNGELLLAKGYGNARPGVAATERTIHRIGSLTKQFTAAAVLRAIEEGAVAPVTGERVTLDTPMGAIFQGVERWNAADEPPITVRSLLNMTSNLPNFTRRPPPDVDPWGAVAAPRLLAELKKLAPTGWPNSFEYSNTSYFLLAQALEVVSIAGRPSGTTYHEYLRSVVIDRAGLTSTGFVDEAAADDELAQPTYRRRPAFAEPEWLKGCGDMASSATDLFAWNRALVSGQLLNDESRTAMFADGGRVGPSIYYGMGWFVGHGDEWDEFSHSGSVPGYTSYNAILRRQGSQSWVSVTLLTNSDGIEGLELLADEILAVVRSN
jgi:CubicO group peptidase (beta-lactamase class C family)